jgi:hypothetical protein
MKRVIKKTALFLACFFIYGCSMPLGILNQAEGTKIYKAWGNRFCTADMYVEGVPDASFKLSNYRLYGNSILDGAPSLPECRYYLMFVTSGYSEKSVQTPGSMALIIDGEVFNLVIANVSSSGAKGKYLLSNAQDSPATPVADVYEMQPFNKKIVYYSIDARLIKRMSESGKLLLKMDERFYDLMKLDNSKRYVPQTFIEGCKKFYTDVVLNQCGPLNAE